MGSLALLDLVPATSNGTNCSIADLCSNGGTCVLVENVTFCDCLTGFSGTACESGVAVHVVFTVFEILCLIYLYLGLAVLVDECVFF